MTGASRGKSPGALVVKLVALLVMPIVLPLAALEFGLYRLGETVPYSTIAARQMSGEHFVYYRGFTDTNFGYKAEFIRRRNFDVATFGDSRVSQFRAGMFEPYRFYNIGNIAYYLRDFAQALPEFPDTFRPKALIIGLGFWMFDEQNREKGLLATRDIVPTIRGRSLIYKAIAANIGWLFAAPATPISNTPAQGLFAIQRGLGFREDGSLRYGFRGSYLGGIFRKRYQELVQKAMHAVDGGPPVAIWGPGDHAVAAWPDLDQFVSFWTDRGTMVIVLNLPTDTRLAGKLREAAAYGIYREYMRLDLGKRLRALGARYFDFTDPASYGSSDDEMTDPIHAGEAGILRMWLAMLEDPGVRSLFPEIDVASLKKLADGPEKFDIFGDFYTAIPPDLRKQM